MTTGYLEGEDTMYWTRKRLTLWLALAVSVTAIAMGAVACGSDDDATGDGAQAADTGSTAGGSDEEQIRAAYDQLTKSVKAGDAKKACAVMTDAAQKQLKIAVKPIRSCEQGVKLVAERIDDAASATPSRVARVAVDGSRARLTVKTPGRAGSNAIVMVKRGGAWKADNLFVGLPQGGAAER